MDAKAHVFLVNKGKITVHAGYCKGCGLCLVKCPQGSIEWANFLGVYGNPAVAIDRKKCNLCGLCALVCPDCAIDVEYIPRPQRYWLEG